MDEPDPRLPSLSDTFSRLPRAWWAYIIAVGALAAYGAAHSIGVLLLATVLGAPVAIGALMASYLIFGLLVVVFDSLGIHVMRSHEWNPTWWVLVFKVIVTVLFTFAAIANATLIEQWLDRRRRGLPGPPDPTRRPRGSSGGRR